MRWKPFVSGERSRKMEKLVGTCRNAPLRGCEATERHKAASGFRHALPDQKIPFGCLEEPFGIEFTPGSDLPQGVERIRDVVAFDPVEIPREDFFHGADFSKSKTQTVVRASSKISEQLEK